VECDVTDDAAMDETFRVLKETWGEMDFLVHAIGFSDKDELEGRYVDTTAGNFAMTMNISVYSFTAVAKRAEALMRPGGSLLTLTYYGAEKYVPNYNVMGVAKAALEASVRYLASTSGRRGSGSTPSPPAPSRRWRLPVLRGSGRCCTGRKRRPRFARTSRSTMWATPRCIFSPICPAA
jgi:NAD(P)-dependent dehydrogenase (short-subunit alcohol dehydrogenase family)